VLEIIFPVKAMHLPHARQQQRESYFHPAVRGFPRNPKSLFPAVGSRPDSLSAVTTFHDLAESRDGDAHVERKQGVFALEVLRVTSAAATIFSSSVELIPKFFQLLFSHHFLTGSC